MRKGVSRIGGMVAAALLAAASSSAQTPPEQPPPHRLQWPDATTWNFPQGPEFQRGRSARYLREQQRRLDAALAGLQPQRPGTIDAYVIAIALDSDPVFSREAREAGNVLARRYDAAGRMITLAGPDGAGGTALPHGSITALSHALARVAELADPAEDVLVLYATSHGFDQGLAYHDGDQGYGVLSPAYLRDVLGELRLDRRVLLLSACYSGVFVPLLATHDTAIVTAAARDRTSFGCAAENDWTYFGDALVNRALRQPQPLALAAAQARDTIGNWEAAQRLTPSNPQVQIGAGAAQWLRRLESSLPRPAGPLVGRPAVPD